MGLLERPQSSNKDVVAFVAACLIGYGVGTFLPDGAWHAYASVLLAYHLFLFWLVITSEEDAGLSFHPASTLLTHGAFLGTVIAILMARRYIPFFSFFGMGIASLAYFEKIWLFGGERNRAKAMQERTGVAVVRSSANDYQEWTKHLAQRKASSVIHGSSLKDEYEQWVKARAQNQSSVSSGD